MDTGVRYQVCLEFRNIDVKCSIKTKRGGERRDDLSNETVQVGVGRALDSEIATADLVESFVVETESAVL